MCYNNKMLKKALVVDDNEFVRETIKEMLEFFGFDVAVTESGEDAVKKYISSAKLNQPFDIVFIDLVLPGMNGKEVLKKLKEIDPEVKAVISSGYQNDPAIREYERLGFKGCLNKPYTLDELKKILENLNLA